MEQERLLNIDQEDENITVLTAKPSSALGPLKDQSNQIDCKVPGSANKQEDVSQAPITVKNVDFEVAESFGLESEGDHSQQVKKFLAELQDEINNPTPYLPQRNRDSQKESAMTIMDMQSAKGRHSAMGTISHSPSRMNIGT